MTIHTLAGLPAPLEYLVDLDALRQAYYARTPDVTDRAQRVTFGTHGHRGSALRGAFNEAHVRAITQAICDYRQRHGITGPLFIGRDTHALSEPAFMTAVEILAVNRVQVMIEANGGCTPAPAVSRAILTHNRCPGAGPADGIVVTPSHNPPADGGVKYSPPSGGPADTAVARWIEARANTLLSGDHWPITRLTYARARRPNTTQVYDYAGAYARDLAQVVDMDAIKGSGLRIGIDPLGGAAASVWRAIADRYGVNVEVVNPTVDPTFRFMPLDWDGQIRMDCSSPYAMATLIGLRDRFDLAFGNDTDADRHGVVTRAAGLMNPNHYLSAAIAYLFRHRPGWGPGVGIGKTAVSSSLIDRLAATIGRPLVEVPVGFKWFVNGLLNGTLGFAGEESAGATCLQRDGAAWTTDKDGIVMDLLAVELMARTGRDPAESYAELTRDLGAPAYERMNVAATPEELAALATITPAALTASKLAGDPLERILTTAPGNGAPLGGLKVVTEHGWFAARPSGTGAVYALYAESFRGSSHLARIQTEAQALLRRVFAGATR